MKPFTVHVGIAAPLLRANVDTDAIIPSREMKRVSKRGLGAGLFAGWRYRYENGEKTGPDPAFVLNQPEYEGASILLAGPNFGCGSSREHAVWALADYGIRAVLAPSFGAIFEANCVRNGVLPVRAEEPVVASLAETVAGDPQGRRIRIDLEQRRFGIDGAGQHGFVIGDGDREMLLQGLDPIALTLAHADRISAFQDRDRERRPWAYLARAD